MEDEEMKVDDIRLEIKIDEKELAELRELNEKFKKSFAGAYQKLAVEIKRTLALSLMAISPAWGVHPAIRAWISVRRKYEYAKVLEQRGMWEHCGETYLIKAMPFCGRCFMPYQDYKKRN
jgi:hypothetical protein